MTHPKPPTASKPQTDPRSTPPSTIEDDLWQEDAALEAPVSMFSAPDIAIRRPIARAALLATHEYRRLEEDERDEIPWRRWGPYLSERQWGTVREDYSKDGDAWNYFPHDHARSRAYRWGEDGLAGYSDNKQYLCFSLALWNEQDPFLKERLFGLTNPEGNHGEDVKELYYYLDATPTHSYLKMLYKYPQQAFPYEQLRQESRNRGRMDREFELLDTGIFEQDRYFDIFVEYAKAAPDDTLIQITAHNRGPQEAPLHLLPQICFRNIWSWKGIPQMPEASMANEEALSLHHPELGQYFLYSAESSARFLFCENNTNTRRLYGAQDAQGPFKDAFHDRVVMGKQDATSAADRGTKAAIWSRHTIPAHGSITLRLRLTNLHDPHPFASFDSIFARRQQEADEYYNALEEDIPHEDDRRIQRQAFAGMIWNKQYYRYNVHDWQRGDPLQPPPPKGRIARNAEWGHLKNNNVISMPDTWEYPWYAAWDLAFHALPFALIDAPFAKRQLLLMTREWYMHPNGQLPAYEWNFSDVNPPVHAWAAWRVFQIDRSARGDQGDLFFLERIFHKLLLNFTWWVNRKDAQGRNVFQGGFLGLDNIGVFDRSKPLPTGGHLDQADGTSWMGMYCLNMLQISLELARHNAVYEDIATKFFEHFLYIAQAMTNMGGEGVGLWDDQDKFFYDVLHFPDGRNLPLKVRSMVGLIPLFAVETIEPETLKRLPNFSKRMHWFLEKRPDLADLVSHWNEPGRGELRLLSLLRGHRMKRLLQRTLDPNEFLSDYGIRSLSRYHKQHPYTFTYRDQSFTVAYVSGESDSGLFGGNSNWRGPIWFPVNYLLIESLQKFHHYYSDDFLVEYPTGSGQSLSLLQIAEHLGQRLAGLFRRGEDGRRPIFGDNRKMQEDPQFRDHLLFHEYFDGDTGRGLGASHQTGWTGLIAKLLQPRRKPS
ncbi:glucosidase [Myxococcota bacterium]|nr:glucosidase [Myxococcota bacterium]